MSHPNRIGAKLRTLIRARGFTIYQACKAMGIRNAELYKTVNDANPLTPATAARLHRIGIDGRALYLEQASLKLERYEKAEAVLLDVTERLCRTAAK